MSSPDERSVRAVSDIYTEPGVEWQVRFLGTHLHPRFEEATVALAARAAHYGFPEGGSILDLASALGGPARFLARRFAATVICIDLNRRMHAALTSAARAEGLTLSCLPVLARTERLPLATASCDGAWSQDALCHMDKPAVLGEVARVLRPDALFAFTDFIARSGLRSEDAEALAHEWGFPSLPRLPQYTALLDEQLDPAAYEVNVRWTRELAEAMGPFTTGRAYVNQMGMEAEEGPDRIKAAYGSN